MQVGGTHHTHKSKGVLFGTFVVLSGLAVSSCVHRLVPGVCTSAIRDVTLLCSATPQMFTQSMMSHSAWHQHCRRRLSQTRQLTNSVYMCAHAPNSHFPQRPKNCIQRGQPRCSTVTVHGSGYCLLVTPIEPAAASAAGSLPPSPWGAGCADRCAAGPPQPPPAWSTCPAATRSGVRHPTMSVSSERTQQHAWQQPAGRSPARCSGQAVCCLHCVCTRAARW